MTDDQLLDDYGRLTAQRLEELIVDKDLASPPRPSDSSSLTRSQLDVLRRRWEARRNDPLSRLRRVEAAFRRAEAAGG